MYKSIHLLNKLKPLSLNFDELTFDHHLSLDCKRPRVFNFNNKIYFSICSSTFWNNPNYCTFDSPDTNFVLDCCFIAQKRLDDGVDDVDEVFRDLFSAISE